MSALQPVVLIIGTRTGPQGVIIAKFVMSRTVSGAAIGEPSAETGGTKLI
jgi:hypothetical protein